MGSSQEKDHGGFKHELKTAAAIGVIAGLADFAATTGWMHRSLTHKAWEPAQPLKLAARVMMWGTGTRPRVWATVHRKHHDNADKPGDPHSPILQGKYGVAKLFFKNTPLYMREARAVEKENVYASDLQADRLDEKIFDKTKVGLAASLLGHMVVNRAKGNPVHMGLVSFGVEKLVYVTGGNLVNSLGHAGVDISEALIKGKTKPHPNGSYGSDSKVVGVLTFGEGNQKYHHEHPESLYFGERPGDMSLLARAIKDLGGTAATELIRVGLASAATVSPEVA